jgi:hypothetical protein
MLRNIGNVDQVLRILLGFAAIAFCLKDGYLGDFILLGVGGAYLLATAFLLFCPIYGALGLSTYGPLDRSI